MLSPARAHRPEMTGDVALVSVPRLCSPRRSEARSSADEDEGIAAAAFGFFASASAMSSSVAAPGLVVGLRSRPDDRTSDIVRKCWRQSATRGAFVFVPRSIASIAVASRRGSS